MSPPVNNIGGANQRTKSKIWVETLLALVIGIDMALCFEASLNNVTHFGFQRESSFVIVTQKRVPCLMGLICIRIYATFF